MKKILIVYWNNIPSPYMVERFNALAARGAFEFEAWFNDRIEPDRSWDVDESTWRFRYRYMPMTRVAEHVFHWPIPLIGKRPDVLVSLYVAPSFLLGWMIAKLRGCRTEFWDEVTFNRWVHRTNLKEAIKRWLFRKVDAIITVGDDGKDFARRYSSKDSSIFFAPHVVDIEHFQWRGFIHRILRKLYYGHPRGQAFSL